VEDLWASGFGWAHLKKGQERKSLDFINYLCDFLLYSHLKWTSYQGYVLRVVDGGHKHLCIMSDVTWNCEASHSRR